MISYEKQENVHLYLPDEAFVPSLILIIRLGR